MAKGNGNPTDDEDYNALPTAGAGGDTADPTSTNEHEEQSDSSVSRRRLLQAGAVGLASTVAVLSVSGNEADHPNTIVFDGTGSSGRSEYTFSVSGGVEPHSDTGPIEINDTLNGSSVSGAVHRDKDAYRFSGTLTALDIAGAAGVSINHGDEGDTEADRLQIVAGSYESTYYSFTTTDKTLRVTDGENPAEDDDEVVENSDGTWSVTGYVGNGHGDSFDFWGDITDFTPMEGSYTLFLNGTEVTPYDLTGEEPPETREHSYSFEGTGDSWADYYLEVEDGGDLIASTLDGAVIESDFHWISDDGTRAAGRVDPGERHAYEFDNLVLDVTVDGDADTFVDGSSSNLDWYPQPGATGDGWKGGFPWQDEDGGNDSTAGPVMGGGSGYENTTTESDADAVVRTRNELEDALGNATTGDVVFVPGDEQISLGNQQYDIPDGVTLASSRGVDGSSGALLYTEYEPWKLLTIEGSGRLTGVRLKGPHPGDDTSGDSAGVGVHTFGAGEVDNCAIWGFPYAGIRAAGGDGAHYHHNVVRENNRGGWGYGVATTSGTPLIEYNYFNFNRHSVQSTGQNPGYTIRYNHFGPESTGGVIDVHKPGGVDLEVHNNVVEAVVSTSGHRDPLQSIQIRGTPEEAYDVHDNWFFNDLSPRDSPSGWTQESIIQATEDTWANIDWWDNYYGEDAAVTYSDIIPDYDGSRTA